MRSLLAVSMGPERIREDALRVLAPFRLRRRGVETKLVLGNPTKSVDRTLLRNIRNAINQQLSVCVCGCFRHQVMEWTPPLT